MSLTSLLPHRVHRGRVVSNVEVIDLPAEVRTNRSVADLTGARIEAHRLADGGGTRTACNKSLALFGIDGTTDMRLRGDVDWCRRCWPGRRCDCCKAPSGQDTLCSACGTVALDADQRIEASQS